MEKAKPVDAHDEEQEGFGAQLRRERLLRGVPLEEISEATNIRRTFLEALENEHFQALPEEVFTRGFIKAYAEYIGIDGDRLVQQYIARIAPPEGEDENEDEVLPVRRSRAPLAILVGVVLVLISLVAVLLWVEWGVGEGSGQASSSIAEPTLTALLHEEQEATIPVEAGETGSIAEAPPLRLVIDAVERSYVRVYADGVEKLDTLLRGGERRELVAEERFSLTVGNAGGINLYINDRKLRSLGERGEVRTMVIQPPFEGLFDE